MTIEPEVGDVLRYNDLLVLIVRKYTRIGEVDVMWLIDAPGIVAGEVTDHYSRVESWKEWEKL